MDDIDVKSILESMPDDYVYKSVTDRYFTRHYSLDVTLEGNDHLLLFHSNRIGVLCLAPSHPLLNRPNVTVDFVVGGTDRTKNAVKGKGKKGGQILEPTSQICTISDGTTAYPIFSCLKGRLIEVNHRLITNPELLTTHTDSEGYLAIILQKIPGCEDRKEELVSHAEYTRICSDKRL